MAIFFFQSGFALLGMLVVLVGGCMLGSRFLHRSGRGRRGFVTMHPDQRVWLRGLHARASASK